ncbi:MAG: PAS domain S-box protein [Oceanococcaceae bacterium]
MDTFDVQPLYRALVENAQDILGVLTSAGVIMTLSPAVRTTLGLSPERLRGRHWIDQVHPDDRAACRRWMAECAEHERHHHTQVRVGRPNQWRVLVLSGRQVQEDVRTIRIVFSARDATEEVRATERLEEREARFRSAFHDAPIGKVLLDAEGRIIDANKAFAELLDRWATELEGADFLSLFGPGEADSTLRTSWKQLKARQRCEFPLRYSHHGRVAHLRISLAPVASQGGAYAIGQVLELTARIEAEEALQRNLQALRQSHHQLQQMAWMASHDLKEPLRGLVGSLQLILRRHADVLGDAEKETAQNAVQQAKALRARLDELEQRVGEMRGSVQQQGEIQLAAVVEEWAEVNAAQLRQAGVRLQKGELPQLRADPRLGASVQSALDHALALVGSSAGTISIAAAWETGRWVLAIRCPAGELTDPRALAEPGGSLFPLRGGDLQLEAEAGELLLQLLIDTH